jgi:hypothetical protein
VMGSDRWVRPGAARGKTCGRRSPRIGAIRPTQSDACPRGGRGAESRRKGKPQCRGRRRRFQHSRIGRG